MRQAYFYIDVLEKELTRLQSPYAPTSAIGSKAIERASILSYFVLMMVFLIISAQINQNTSLELTLGQQVLD